MRTFFRMLFSQIQAGNNVSVSVYVFVPKIIQQSAALADHLQ
jgi:hypothetical protein